VAIVRECLMALAELHRESIVHGDIKPSNVMLKRSGNAKIIDIGSAFEIDNPPPIRTCTPFYAAPEVLDGSDITPRSDLASLGYVLIEMLSGRQPFADLKTYRELLEAKRMLPQQLAKILPAEVTVNELLMNFCRGLIAPDPQARFQTAEAANLAKDGASAFLRQLVKGDMSSEYDNEIRLLIGELQELNESLDEDHRSTK
jgi:serine/threonine-protein kinase